MQSEIEVYIKSVRSICPNLTEDELAEFAAILSVKELKRKEYFIQSGKIQKEIGFIASGLTRSYYVDSTGNEITVGFYSEGDYATHYPAFIA